MYSFMKYYETMTAELSHEAMLDELFGRDLGDWHMTTLGGGKAAWARSRQLEIPYLCTVVFVAPETTERTVEEQEISDGLSLLTNKTTQEVCRDTGYGMITVIDRMLDIRRKLFSVDEYREPPVFYKDVSRIISVQSGVGCNRPTREPSKGSWEKKSFEGMPESIMGIGFESAPKRKTPVSDLTLHINDQQIDAFDATIRALIAFKQSQCE